MMCVFLITLLATSFSFIVAQDTIVDVAIANSDTFGTLVAALGAADLVETLQGDGPFTVFAPTDDAFDHLPNGVLGYLLEPDNKAVLTDILLYHVISGAAVMSKDISDGQTATTVQGDDVTFSIYSRRGRTQSIYVEHSKVIDADIDASNGVIHAIDQVLVPPSVELPLDIVDTAIKNDLDTLVAAVVAAGLEDTLRGDGPFTVFAPTEDAFAALPVDVFSYLLRTPDELAKVLLYHVVVGAAVPAASILDGSVTSATAASGDTLTLAPGEGTVVINTDEAKVVVADVEANNGIVHVIDAVLVPPSLELPPTIVETAVSLPDTFSTLVTALTEAGLVDDLSGAGPFTVFAPTNDAFAALGTTLDDLLADPEGELKDILLYHVVSGYIPAETIVEHAPFKLRTLNGNFVDVKVEGSSVMIDESTVITPDVFALNGVIHVIDAVLIPPDDVECPYIAFICWLFGWH